MVDRGWPDPKRPGYPAMPDQEGPHMLGAPGRESDPRARKPAWWAPAGHWHVVVLDGALRPKQVADACVYLGPLVIAAGGGIAPVADPLPRIREVIDLWFAPWGAWKTVAWEAMSGDRAFNPDIALEIIRDRLAARPTTSAPEPRA